MDPLSILELVLKLLIIPAGWFLWEVRQGFKDAHRERDELVTMVKGNKESLLSNIKEMQTSNSKEHDQVIGALKELQNELRDSERRNQQEHRELGEKLHDFELNNAVQHTVLNKGVPL